MTVYYVSSILGSDDNPGNAVAAPLASLRAAARLVRPGDTVEVMNGTYSNPSGLGWGVVTISTSGTAAAPITFMAMPGQTPVIDSTNNWAGIAIVGASFINVEGFDVVGDARSVTQAYAQSQATNLNNPITSGDGIDVEQASPTGAIPNHITIQNNIVHDEPGSGIDPMNADYISILNNTVFGNANWSPYADSGISIGFSKSVDNAPGYHEIISGNTVFANQELIPNQRTGTMTDGNGIIIDSNNTYGYTGQVLVQDNIAYDNGGSGIQAFDSNAVTILGNTAYSNAFTPGPGDHQIDFQNSTRVTIRNNVTVTPALMLSTVAPAVVERGQTTEVAVVTYAHVGDVLSVVVTSTSRGGTLTLLSVAGVKELIYTAPTAIAVGGTDAVTYQIEDAATNTSIKGTVSVVLNAGPVIVPVSAKPLGARNTEVIATVRPGLTGDMLTLVETATTQGGVLSLSLAGGIEQIIYTAPSTVGAAATDGLGYSIKDQHDDVAVVGTASIMLIPSASPVIGLAVPSAIPVGYVGETIRLRGLTVTDLIASQMITLVLSANSGTLAMTSATGTAVTGSGAGSMTISGTAAQLNAELATLAYAGTMSGTAKVMLKATGVTGVTTQASEVVTVLLDTLSLVLSEDAYLGNAQFVVKINGIQIGGPTAVTALHARGATQTFTYSGNWSADPSSVEIDYLNDLYGSRPLLDRNLYVNQLNYNGVAALLQTMPIWVSSDFVISAGSPPPAIGLLAPSSPLADRFGNAIAVTGLVVSDSVASDDVTLILSARSGTLLMTNVVGTSLAGSGTSQIRVSGTSAQLNAELGTLKYTGIATGAGAISLLATDAAGAKAGASISTVVSPDSLSLSLSEDAYKSNAQFILKVDGQTIGGPTPVSALRAGGASQSFNYAGHWGIGPQTVEVDYVNDLYGGSATADRNLYVNQITYNGSAEISHTVPLYVDGAYTLIVHPST